MFCHVLNMNKANKPEMVLTCVNSITEYLRGQAVNAGFKRRGIKKSHSHCSAGGLGAASAGADRPVSRAAGDAVAAAGQPPLALAQQTFTSLRHWTGWRGAHSPHAAGSQTSSSPDT